MQKHGWSLFFDASVGRVKACHWKEQMVDSLHSQMELWIKQLFVFFSCSHVLTIPDIIWTLATRKSLGKHWNVGWCVHTHARTHLCSVQVKQENKELRDDQKPQDSCRSVNNSITPAHSSDHKALKSCLETARLDSLPLIVRWIYLRCHHWISAWKIIKIHANSGN